MLFEKVLLVSGVTMDEKRVLDKLVATLDAATAPGMRDAYCLEVGSGEKYDEFIEELRKTIQVVAN
jgi:hypothetical protein